MPRSTRAAKRKEPGDGAAEEEVPPEPVEDVKPKVEGADRAAALLGAAPQESPEQIVFNLWKNDLLVLPKEGGYPHEHDESEADQKKSKKTAKPKGGKGGKAKKLAAEEDAGDDDEDKEEDKGPKDVRITEPKFLVLRHWSCARCDTKPSGDYEQGVMRKAIMQHFRGAKHRNSCSTCDYAKAAPVAWKKEYQQPDHMKMQALVSEIRKLFNQVRLSARPQFRITTPVPLQFLYPQC